MQEECRRLAEQVENLRCCGNCMYYQAGNNVCPEDCFCTRAGWEYCEKWAYDEFKQKDRLSEEYNGN